MNQPFNFPDGRVANNAEELLELCEQYPDDATSFLVRQDLEKWLAYIGNYDVAECAANARQTDTGDRQKLEEFLNKCHSLTAQKPVPAAVTGTDIKDNMTAPESATATEVPPKWTESASRNAENASEDNLPSPNLDAATPPKQPKSVVETAPDKNSSAEAIATPQTPEKPKSATPVASSTKPETKAKANPTPSSGGKKPSFFQVVAKFLVKILYRDKA